MGDLLAMHTILIKPDMFLGERGTGLYGCYTFSNGTFYLLLGLMLVVSKLNSYNSYKINIFNSGKQKIVKVIHDVIFCITTNLPATAGSANAYTV